MGITSREPEKRWGKNGNGYEKSSFVKHAIDKYGWENVSKEIIASRLTKEEAQNFERLLIKKMDLMNPEHGYN